MKPLILPYKGILPKIADDAFIAPGAVVIGDVEIGSETNVWFGCVIRGDVNTIRIGSRTSIQDGTVVHVTRKTAPTVIGSGVTIGHQALLHGCEVQDGAFIGMQSMVMDNAVVESGAMVAAGAVITPRKRVPSGEIWAGNPAKHMRALTPEETAFIQTSENNYVLLAQEYLRAQS
ncbi:MAG: gamma carbonic anhydrase family protein [Hyphomicrobiales bacterium]|nr:gamma carbonic anhydrase family protein [Rickettsiales bacterium]MCP5361762.1 gamma carbonic anhydrase family protein [Hyphomicrobiales bacterium]